MKVLSCIRVYSINSCTSPMTTAGYCTIGSWCNKMHMKLVSKKCHCTPKLSLFCEYCHCITSEDTPLFWVAWGWVFLEGVVMLPCSKAI